jgi:Tic22-like family
MYKSALNLIAIAAMSVPSVISFVPVAQALPEAQVLQKLQEIPVFTITNGKGGIYKENVGTGAKAKVFTRVFIGIKDAQAFLQSFRNSKFKEAKLAQITPVPLSAIYKLQIAAKEKKDNMSFVFFPTEPQLKNALSILKKQYQPNAVYPVPLFMVAIKQKDQYVTIQRNKLTPLFFEREDAQRWLDTVKKQDPKLVAKAEIKVNYLQNILEDLHGRTYPGQEQLVLVPSRENQDIVRKIQASQNKTAQPPASTPPKK